MRLPGMRKEGTGGKGIRGNGNGVSDCVDAADDHYALQQHRVAVKKQKPK